MDWESYPIGLKVLAVDDDPLCLKVVERMLKRCRYDGKVSQNCVYSVGIPLRGRPMQISSCQLVITLLLQCP